MKKIIFFLVPLLVLFGSDSYARNKEALVCVNGELMEGTVTIKDESGGVLVDGQAFASKLPDLLFFRMPIPPNPGLVLQYGKRISFASDGFDAGFCSTSKVAMEPPLEISGGTYWTPLGFFAGAVSGEISVESVEEDTWIIDVTMPPALEIGSIVPQAKDIAKELETDFIVRQGDISLIDAVQMYITGYALNCNGNNAKSSYLVVQSAISPRAEFYNRLPMVLSMDQDEAMVWVGYTPPECKYFSFQHYLVNRSYLLENPPTVKKLYARLGDSINSYNIPLKNDPFKKFYVFIIANNINTRQAITDAIKNAGIAEDRILGLVVPSQTEPGIDMKFGQGPFADSFHFLLRASLFDRNTDKEEYTNQPTLEILRVTPRTKLAFNPIPRPPGKDRITDVREQTDTDLGDLIERLQTEIITAHAGNYKYAKLLGTSTWSYPGGDVAIEERQDVLGETNDSLYLKSGEFVLNDDDLIVVFGPNHTETGKSVYSNVSMYGAEAINGIGGINSIPCSPDAPDRLSYFGTAEEYLPDVPKEQQEKLYVYKFARNPIDESDESTFVIPYNDEGSYEGFNNGDSVFMGFRSYVDLLTTIGPYPGDVRDGDFFDYMGPPDSEVYFDQAILFTNKKPKKKPKKNWR